MNRKKLRFEVERRLGEGRSSCLHFTYDDNTTYKSNPFGLLPVLYEKVTVLGCPVLRFRGSPDDILILPVAVSRVQSHNLP